MQNRILVRRSGALGDVLSVTPVLRRFRDKYGPSFKIVVETHCPQALEGNPFVNEVYAPGQAPGPFAISVNLDLAYEKRPTHHVVDAYMIEAFGNSSYDHKRVIFPIKPPAPRYLVEPDRVITIHAARSWPSRTMPDQFWRDTVALLREREFNVLFLGGPNDFAMGPEPGVGSAVGKTSLTETVNLISNSLCLLCSDSALLHLAGATDTPIVPLFTSVRAQYRIPYRHKVKGWKVTPIEADVPCQGCLETVPAPATNLSCRYTTNACVRSILPERVVETAVEMAAQRWPS